MRKKELTTAEKIIQTAAIRCGYTRGYMEICERCGFVYKTFWEYRKSGNFPISWVRAMDKLMGFTDEELLMLVRG